MKKKLLYGCRNVIIILFVIAGFIAYSELKFAHSPVRNSAYSSNIGLVDDDEALSSNCGGIERWDVKIMTDTAAYRLVLTPNMTTLLHLVTLPTPVPNGTMPRFNPVEDSVYTVVCTLTAKIDESDSDYHLILSDGANTMIGEIPDPHCSSVVASPYINQFIKARRWVDSVIGAGTNYSLNIKNVEVTGQAFIDPPHNQSGAAINNLELHSILKIGFSRPLTGTISIAVNEGLKIYPNPGNGLFYINMPASKGNERVEVFTMEDEEICKCSINSNRGQINITGKPPCIYLYKIISGEGEFISAGKLLVQ